jgi:hypothetical protein
LNASKKKQNHHQKFLPEDNAQIPTFFRTNNKFSKKVKTGPIKKPATHQKRNLPPHITTTRKLVHFLMTTQKRKVSKSKTSRLQELAKKQPKNERVIKYFIQSKKVETFKREK